MNLKRQALEEGDESMVTLVEAILSLLNADGDGTGMQPDLNDDYGEIWQRITRGLSRC